MHIDSKTVDDLRQKKKKKNKRVEKDLWELELESSWFYKFLQIYARVWLTGTAVVVVINMSHVPISYEMGSALLALELSPLAVCLILAGMADDAGKY